MLSCAASSAVHPFSESQSAGKFTACLYLYMKLPCPAFCAADDECVHWLGAGGCGVPVHCVPAGRQAVHADRLQRRAPDQHVHAGRRLPAAVQGPAPGEQQHVHQVRAWRLHAPSCFVCVLLEPVRPAHHTKHDHTLPVIPEAYRKLGQVPFVGGCLLLRGSSECTSLAGARRLLQLLSMARHAQESCLHDDEQS